MMTRKVLWLALFAILSGAFAHEEVLGEGSCLFGPVRYERGAGEPTTRISTFSSPIAGPHFTLRIHNGDDRGGKRISSAIVSLNGNRVAGPADFNQRVEWIERTVSLEAANELAVRLLGPPGGCLTVSIWGKGSHPKPTLTFSASPEVIPAGGTSTLSWNSTHAEAASIEPGIGPVEVSGSTSVSPGKTTTYWITVSGPGGTVSASAVVTIDNLPPRTSDDTAVTVAGAPVTINVLENDTDPEDDPLSVVGVNQGAHGTVSINPDSTLTYTPNVGFHGEDSFTYTAGDVQGGMASATVTVTVQALSAISLTITSPAETEQVAGASIQVRGSVRNASGKETGVTVNGIPAVVSGEYFVASGVALTDGENIITAVAIDPEGNTASASVTILADPEGEHLKLYALTASGVPPFDVILIVDAPIGFTNPSISWIGPAEVEILQSPEPRELRARITVEGIYHVRAETTDAQGQPHSATATIIALSRAQLDGLLTAKWSEMKENLQSGRVEGALRYFREGSRERYRAIFSALGDKVRGIASGMSEIEMLHYRDRRAEYRIRREHLVEGEPVTIAYSIFFELDEDGLWKIDGF